MKVEILHIEDCPNWTAAGRRAREALALAGVFDAEVSFRLLTTSEEAAAVPFAGSPTILIDGIDAFPSEGRTSDLACRVYVTGGSLAGLPTTEQLVERFRMA